MSAIRSSSGNDGGVWRSTDDGSTWTDKNLGLVTYQFYDICVAQTSADTVFGGTQDQGTDRYEGTGTWENSLGADGMVGRQVWFGDVPVTTPCGGCGGRRGSIATGGFHSEMLNGMEVVLPTGEIAKVGSCATSPYWFSRAPLPDLAGLFIGWHGTTGIATKLAIKLYPDRPLGDVGVFVMEDPELVPGVIHGLAGVAVATAARRFAQRHLDTSAIMRCLGATQGRITALFSLEMLWLALIASSLGAVLGYLTQLVIAEIMGQLLLASLPQPSLKPLLLGYATGIILLLGFAMPPLLALKRVPPVRGLRKDVAGARVSSWLFTLGVLCSMGLLLYWQTQDPKLVIYMLSGIVVTLLLLAACSRLMIAGLNSIRGQVGIAWRFGLANIARRPSGSVIQVVAFGLGIMPGLPALPFLLLAVAVFILGQSMGLFIYSRNLWLIYAERRRA